MKLKLFFFILLYSNLNANKIAIINFYDQAQHQFHKYSIWNKNEYAQNNNYDIFHYSYLNDSKFSWSKTLENHLNKYEWILCTHGNSLIANNEGKIEDLIENECHFIFDSTDARHNFLIKNCKESKELLNKITLEDLKGNNNHIKQYVDLSLTQVKVSNKFDNFIKIFQEKDLRTNFIQILSKAFPNYFKRINIEKIRTSTKLTESDFQKLSQDLIQENEKQEPGWHDSYYDILPSLINKLNLKTGAEIGVAFGGHSQRLLQETNIKKLYSIDAYQNLSDYKDPLNFQNSSFEILYNVVKKRLSNFGKRVKLIRSTSLDAANSFEDNELDFVFIDANHSYENVKADLNAWFCKANTLVAGDDYIIEIFPDLVKGVNEFFQEKGMTIHHHKDCSRIWFVLKNE